MKITFEGREWDFELEKITVKQAVAMHLAYGFTLDSWFAAAAETDPRALQCLWWLMLAQDGQTVAIKDADCELIGLALAFTQAQGEQEEPEPEPGPTSPPSTSPDPPLSARSGPEDATPARPKGGDRGTASMPSP